MLTSAYRGAAPALSTLHKALCCKGHFTEEIHTTQDQLRSNSYMLPPVLSLPVSLPPLPLSLSISFSYRISIREGLLDSSLVAVGYWNLVLEPIYPVHSVFIWISVWGDLEMRVIKTLMGDSNPTRHPDAPPRTQSLSPVCGASFRTCPGAALSGEPSEKLRSIPSCPPRPAVRTEPGERGSRGMMAPHPARLRLRCGLRYYGLRQTRTESPEESENLEGEWV